MSTAESANENDLSPAQRFNGFLPFSTCNPKNLTPYAKFQRIQASKTQRKEKKHRCRPEIVLAHSGAFSENVRKPVENTRFSIKVGAEILILIVSKSPSLHGSMWQKCFFREVLWHNEIQTLKCQFWNDAKAFSANSGYLKPLLIFSFSASISSTDFFPSDL